MLVAFVCVYVVSGSVCSVHSMPMVRGGGWMGGSSDHDDGIFFEAMRTPTSFGLRRLVPRATKKQLNHGLLLYHQLQKQQPNTHLSDTAPSSLITQYRRSIGRRIYISNQTQSLFTKTSSIALHFDCIGSCSKQRHHRHAQAQLCVDEANFRASNSSSFCFNRRSTHKHDGHCIYRPSR